MTTCAACWAFGLLRLALLPLQLLQQVGLG